MTRLILFLIAILLATPAAAVELSRYGNILRPSAAYTTDLTTSFENQEGFCGMYIILVSTLYPAGAVVTIRVEWVEIAANVTTSLIHSFAGTLSAVETVVFEVRSGVPAADTAVVNEVFDRALPARFNIHLDHTDADSITYSASVQPIRYCG